MKISDEIITADKYL